MKLIQASERTPTEKKYVFCKDDKGVKYVAFYTYGGKQEIEFEDEEMLQDWVTVDKEKDIITLNAGWYEEIENCGYYDEMTYRRNIVEWYDDEAPDPLTERLKAAEALIIRPRIWQSDGHKQHYDHWQQLKEQTKDILP